MTLDDILANVADQDRGREFELADPVTGAPTGIKLWVVGPDSDTANRARVALYDELAELSDSDGKVSAESREKARLNCLARHVLRWEIEENGEPVPFNQRNLMRLLRVPWCQAQVDAFASERAAHRGDA
ncbi:hypothetical protein [Consotaella aegiceratis]|uniref:hypothetical protein n=1 Tax=Consotaella aegiceratis TaxID=3097961 RepID=UPI002F42E284